MPFSCLRKLREKNICFFPFSMFLVMLGTMFIMISYHHPLPTSVTRAARPKGSISILKRGRAPCHGEVPSCQSPTGTFPMRESLSMLLPFCEPICFMLGGSPVREARYGNNYPGRFPEWDDMERCPQARVKRALLVGTTRVK